MRSPLLTVHIGGISERPRRARSSLTLTGASVRLIAAAAPGGNPDVLARMLAAKLADAFGRPFVVENLPGAGGVVAAEQVARAAADGHTKAAARSASPPAPR